MSGGTQFPSPVILVPQGTTADLISPIDPATLGPVVPGMIWRNPTDGSLAVRTALATWATIAIGTLPAVGLVGDIVAETAGAVAAAGASGRYADAAHLHAAARAIATSSARGNAAATGAVGSFADSGHVHGREAISVAVPIVASGSGAAGVAANSSNEDHVHPAAGSGATGSTAAIAGNTTMTNANQFYDGASLALVAGSYLIVATTTIITVATVNGQLTVKLWDGATVAGSGEETCANIAGQTEWNSFCLHGLVVVGGGGATWKISVASTTANQSIVRAAAADNGAGNNASAISALKFA